MTAQQFYLYLKKQTTYALTEQQDAFLKKICEYLIAHTTDEIFILKGFAGTGKTTMLSFLVNHLNAIQKKAVLLAPTGRAAKVISGYSGKQAYTIHKHIYYPPKNGKFIPKKNNYNNTVFIVDEASMIADYASENFSSQQNSILEDLIQYVFSGKNCQLMFVGDTAQLPPVGQVESPALNPTYLKNNFPIDIQTIELTEVVRQKERSGILHNATELRELIQKEQADFFQFQLQGTSDVERLTDSYDVLDAIHSAYQNEGIDETIFIVRSNKRANIYNQQIRHRILDIESEIAVGDLLMVVKNNYFWLNSDKNADFIANGDIIEVEKVYNYIDLYGFRFARVQVQLIDFPNIPPFETIIHLNTLNSDSAALSQDEMQQLYNEVSLDYEDELTAYRKLSRIKNNEYFNALQVKFAYAVTCHKAQGGQWKKVFVEQPYIPEGLNEDHARWLYTALTRAKEKIYLLGFEDKYFIPEHHQ